jgi:hypothetical protein
MSTSDSASDSENEGDSDVETEREEIDKVPVKGRPRGSKNKTFEQKIRESLIAKNEEAKRKPGRPRGAVNKYGYKRSFKKPLSKISYAQQYMNATGGAPGQGNILQLLVLLTKAVQANWPDTRVRQHFGNGKNFTHCDKLENACHVHMSSKGRNVSADEVTLSTCVLFPGVDITVSFLDHYIHSPADLRSYGDFVTQTRAQLQKSALLLGKQPK